MTEIIYKTSNGIFILKYGDAFYLAADDNWHLKNCIQVTDLFVLEWSKEFGFEFNRN